MVYVIGYVPLGVFGARVNTPSLSILNGPLVTGVTSVLVLVTGTPFKVSFVVTLPIVVGAVVLGVCVVFVCSIACIGLTAVIVSVTVSQFAGTTATPVVGFTSHMV